MDGTPPVQLVLFVLVCDYGDMENTLTYQQMYRDTYSPVLDTALQQKVSRLTGLVTHLSGCRGKRMEFNSRGKTEADWRTERYEEKQPEELEYGKRCMLPVGFRHALKFSEDDRHLRGDFSVETPQFIEELANSFARKMDQIVLGSVWDDVRKIWTIAQPESSIDPKTSFYNGKGLGGILGPCYTGENLVKAETMPLYPVLKGGELATSISQYNGKNIDMELTNVIPHTYVRKGTPTASGLTKGKIWAIMEALQTRYALNPGEMINLAVTPQMHWELSEDPDFMNKNNGFQMMKEGLVNLLLQVRIVPFNNIPQVEIDGEMVYVLPAWKSEDVYFGVWENPKMEVVKPSMSYTKYVISGMGAAGCARRRLDSVLAVHVAV